MTRPETEPDYPALLSGFDLFSPDHVSWRDEAFAYAREQCPVVRTEAGTGFWLITRYEDMRLISEDWETFSSVNNAPSPTPVRLGPLDADPPMHTGLRRLLNPIFSRTFSMRFAEEMRTTCRELIDGWIGDGRLDVIGQYSGPFVSRTLARMVFDEDDPERMARAIAVTDRVTHEGTPEAFMDLAMLSSEYLAKARASPPEREGVLRALVTGEIDGAPVPEEEALGSLNVIFLGGLDTTKSAIGHIVYQLARHPELEARVRDPRWIRHDMDEFIRLPSPVCTYARTATRDTEVAGVPIRAGERVLIRVLGQPRRRTVPGRVRPPVRPAEGRRQRGLRPGRAPLPGRAPGPGTDRRGVQGVAGPGHRSTIGVRPGRRHLETRHRQRPGVGTGAIHADLTGGLPDPCPVRRRQASPYFAAISSEPSHLL